MVAETLLAERHHPGAGELLEQSADLERGQPGGLGQLEGGLAAVGQLVQQPVHPALPAPGLLGILHLAETSGADALQTLIGVHQPVDAAVSHAEPALIDQRERRPCHSCPIFRDACLTAAGGATLSPRAAEAQVLPRSAASGGAERPGQVEGDHRAHVGQRGHRRRRRGPVPGRCPSPCASPRGSTRTGATGRRTPAGRAPPPGPSRRAGAGSRAGRGGCRRPRDRSGFPSSRRRSRGPRRRSGSQRPTSSPRPSAGTPARTDDPAPPARTGRGALRPFGK